MIKKIIHKNKFYTIGDLISENNSSHYVVSISVNNVDACDEKRLVTNNWNSVLKAIKKDLDKNNIKFKEMEFHRNKKTVGFCVLMSFYHACDTTYLVNVFNVPKDKRDEFKSYFSDEKIYQNKYDDSNEDDEYEDDEDEYDEIYDEDFEF